VNKARTFAFLSNALNCLHYLSRLCYTLKTSFLYSQSLACIWKRCSIEDSNTSCAPLFVGLWSAVKALTLLQKRQHIQDYWWWLIDEHIIVKNVGFLGDKCHTKFQKIQVIKALKKIAYLLNHRDHRFMPCFNSAMINSATKELRNCTIKHLSDWAFK
jgi:hypothetical protein